MPKNNSAKKSKPETLHVGLLLDESGSMCGNEAAVIGGVKSSSSSSAIRRARRRS